MQIREYDSVKIVTSPYAGKEGIVVRTSTQHMFSYRVLIEGFAQSIWFREEEIELISPAPMHLSSPPLEQKKFNVGDYVKYEDPSMPESTPLYSGVFRLKEREEGYPGKWKMVGGLTGNRELHLVDEKYLTHVYTEEDSSAIMNSLVADVELPENRIESMQKEVREVLLRYREPKQADGKKHYTNFVIEPLDLGYLNNLNSAQVKVIKYLMRHSTKGGATDIHKAIDILHKILQYEYGESLNEG